MEKFAEKKIKYWTDDYTKEITKLENNKNLTKEEKKLLIKLKKQKNEQIKILKKNYKLYSCNINCKNTLLEPGPPNEIPKYMHKELIKIFSKRRKEVFKNKMNVLKDNFYENIPEVTKQKLIKEGAISDCVLPSKLSGGSVIFKDGKKIKTNETFNGKPFFRKVFYYSDPPNENQIIAAENEYVITKILINNPFPNIVTFYTINKDYVEMEELDITTKLNKGKVVEIMRKVKDFLQSLGIMYIDWKPDNIGISNDGTYKLFDFDVSGLIDLKTSKWIVKPLEYWNYKKAIENGFKTPQQIDDFSFDYGIVGIKDQPF
jgi:serine/threonine protein kinase